MSSSIIWIVLIVLLGGMWFMSSRSRKQQAKANEFRNSLKAGDEVMTGSGMVGTVVTVEGDHVTLASPSGHQTTWVRAAIARVIEPTEPVPDADDDADDDWSREDIEVPDDLSSLEDKPADPPAADESGKPADPPDDKRKRGGKDRYYRGDENTGSKDSK